jgi:hypothetical protein
MSRLRNFDLADYDPIEARADRPHPGDVEPDDFDDWRIAGRYGVGPGGHFAFEAETPDYGIEDW